MFVVDATNDIFLIKNSKSPPMPFSFIYLQGGLAPRVQLESVVLLEDFAFAVSDRQHVVLLEQVGVF